MTSLIHHKRMFRLMEIIKILHVTRYTVKGLAIKFQSDERTVYRYLTILEELGVPLEKGFDNKYFIVPGPCPFCGGKN